MELRWERGPGWDIHREAQSKASSIQLWGRESWRTGRDTCFLLRINLRLRWPGATLDAGSPGGSSSGIHPPARERQETRVRSLGQEGPLE